MDELKVFNYEKMDVRVVQVDGEAWFVGKDSATILAYKDTAQAIRVHVDDDDKRVVKITTPRGRQNATIINESGLYSLILSSKLPEAKKFKHWVTSEVLPSIRKNGVYMTPQTLERTIQDPDYMIGLLQALKEEQEARKTLQNKIEVDRPKVELAEAISSTNDCILVRDFAKILTQNGVKRMGEKNLYKWLRDNGFLIKTRGSSWNTPTQKYSNSGYFRVKENVITKTNGQQVITKTTMITGKGQSYLYKRIINDFLNSNCDYMF